MAMRTNGKKYIAPIQKQQSQKIQTTIGKINKNKKKKTNKDK